MFTVRDLVGGLIVGVALGAAIDGSGKSFPTLARALAIVVAGSAVITSARLWGGDMGRLAGVSNTRAGGWSAALALTPAVVIVGLILGELEPVFVQRGARLGLELHVVYMLLFVAATMVVAAVGAFALGTGLYRAAFGLRLAIPAGLAAAAAFLAVVLVMDALGWRVGAPDAGRRATMIVVTAISLFAAAASAGGAIGAMLPRPSQEPA
jgi:hypothetical protein